MLMLYYQAVMYFVSSYYLLLVVGITLENNTKLAKQQWQIFWGSNNNIMFSVFYRYEI